MKKVVLLFEGRTGSSMFGGMLNQQPGVGFLGEEVAHLRHEGWAGQAEWIDRLFAEPPKLDDERLLPFEGLRVVGFKVKLREVASAEGLRETLVKHRAHVIHMTRRNLVKQTVSSIRATDLYETSGRYNLELGQEDLRPGRYAIPLGRFEETLRWLESHVEALERFVRALPLPVLPVRYEDVLADAEGAVAGVCRWLEVPREGVETESIKVTPDDLSKVVSNYDELARHYAGTPYEPYFE